MKKLLVVCIIVLASGVACTAVLPDCTEVSSEHREIESYLAHCEDIINEATDVALRISDLYENTDRYSEGQIVAKCATYGKEYDDLLTRLVELECPQQCSKLHEYAIDGITYSKEEVTEYGAAYATGDIEHLHEAESYYNKAQRALALAAQGWDKLNES